MTLDELLLLEGTEELLGGLPDERLSIPNLVGPPSVVYVTELEKRLNESFLKRFRTARGARIGPDLLAAMVAIGIGQALRVLQREARLLAQDKGSLATKEKHMAKYSSKKARRTNQKPKAKKPLPEVKIGQIWVDNDRRANGKREVEVLRVSGGTVGVQVVAHADHTQLGKRTTISQARFKPTASGYVLKTAKPVEPKKDLDATQENPVFSTKAETLPAPNDVIIPPAPEQLAELNKKAEELGYGNTPNMPSTQE